MDDVKVVPRLTGGKIIAALKEAAIKTVVALPDITTSNGLLWPLSKQDELRLVRVSKRMRASRFARRSLIATTAL